MLPKNVSHILVIPLFQTFQRLCISGKARVFKLHDADLSPISLSLMLVILPTPNPIHSHWLDGRPTNLTTPLREGVLSGGNVPPPYHLLVNSLPIF